MTSPEKQRDYYARRRAMVNEVKNVPCMDCGQSYPPCVMDFDHRPGEEKLFNLGRVGAYGKASLLAEMAKCDVVCANCHRMRTAARGHDFGGGRPRTEGPKPDVPRVTQPKPKAAPTKACGTFCICKACR